MKIVCVGCSWTDSVLHISPDETHTYPHIIKEHYPESEVYNFGLSGGSNALISVILDWVLENIKPDVVIRQYSSWNRWQYCKNEKALEYIRYDEMEPGYFKLERKSISEQFISWTANKVSFPEHHKHEYSQKEMDNMHRTFCNHNTFEMVTYMEEAIYFRTQAQLQNVNNIQFFWRDYSKARLSNHWSHLPVIQNQPWHDDHTIDEGGHFGRSGNELLFENIINPELKKYV